MADYTALKAEIANDPLALGYAGKTDAQVAAIMNGADRSTTVPTGTINASDVFEAIDRAEFDALSAASQARINNMLSMGTVNVQGTNTRAVFGFVFTVAAAPKSRAALLALSTTSVPRTRAQEIFGVAVTAADITAARSQ